MIIPWSDLIYMIELFMAEMAGQAIEASLVIDREER